MKRFVLRASALALILALGLLAIAHGQRAVTGAAADDGSSNPLRGGQTNPPPQDQQQYPQNGQQNGPQTGIGPVDTDVPPGDNPLRPRRPNSDGNVRQASNEEPQGQAPLRIRLVADGPANGGNAAGGNRPGSNSPGNNAPSNNSAGSNSTTAGNYRAGEPQLMPAAADRYAIPAQAAGGMPTSAMAAGGISSSTAGNVVPTSGIASGLPDMRSGFQTSKATLYNGQPRIVPPDPTSTYLPGSIRETVPYEGADGNASAPAGTGQPGEKRLEGSQSPQIVIQKIAPPEIQVGRPAVLRVIVRNTGTVAASDVEVRDQVPRGTRLLGTAPTAAQGPHNELVWSLGTLKPGAETYAEMQIMPTDEGEVGSVATVRFQADATARSIVTRPKLVVTTSGAKQVLLGEETMLVFMVSNPGSGVAAGVELSEQIPAGLKHAAGSKLAFTVGDLRPGESRELRLPLKAVQAGNFTNLVTVHGAGNLSAEHRFDLQVTSPQLDLAVAGPKRRYLEREATYQLSVSNPGTAPAQQVQLVAYLPQSLKFIKADHNGQYDPATQAVYWKMDELPVSKSGTVELVALPMAPGQFSIKVRGATQRGLVAEKEQPVTVEGMASVLFQLSHTKDPLEIGGETTYEISVVNQGSKASSNLQISVFLPAELKPMAAEGPTRYTIESNKVVFEAMPQLGAKSAAAFRVRAKGIRAGDLRVRCQLMSDDMQQPVVKEESTRVYADE